MANFNVLARDGGKLSESILTGSDTLVVAGNVTVGDGATIGSASGADALTIASSGNVTAAYDLIVTGDLTVNGTNTTVNVETLLVDQPQIEMGLVDGSAPSSDANLDVGMIMHYHTGSAAKTAFFGWDDSASKATFIADATETSNVFSGSVGTIVANLEGDVTGDVTGNVTGTAGSLENAQNFSLTGDVTASSVSFDGTGAVSLTTTIAANAVESGMLNTNVITGQTDLGAAPANDDSLLIYDTSATALREVTISELLTNAGTFSSFDLAADSGSAETVDDAETLTISGTTNQVSTAVAATNTVTISIDSTVNFTTGSDQTLGYANPSGTDIDGHNVNIKGQRSTGSGGGAEVRLWSTDVGGPGSTLNPEVKVFAATSEGAKFYQPALQELPVNASSGTISRFELVGVDLAKGTSADDAIIGMQGSYVDADTSNAITLFSNNQVLQGGYDFSSMSSGDQVFLANDGTLTNSTSGITNNIYQVGYVVDNGTDDTDGVFYLDVKHIMSL